MRKDHKEFLKDLLLKTYKGIKEKYKKGYKEHKNKDELFGLSIPLLLDNIEQETYDSIVYQARLKVVINQLVGYISQLEKENERLRDNRRKSH